MAHNLQFNAVTGQYNAFFATGKRGLPWHELGKMVRDAQNWEQAAELSGLDFTVSKHQLISPITGRDIPTYGIFRDDNNDYLGNVGAVYKEIQPAQAFDFVDTLLEAEKGAHYESAGILGAGERFWVLARVPYSINIEGTNDTTECYMLFESSHDGTKSATAKLTTVRVVCQNTLSMALNGSGEMVKIRHSSNGTAKLEAAKKMLSGTAQTVSSLSDKLNILAKRIVSKEINLKIMSELFGSDWNDSPRKRDQIQTIARLYASNDHNAIPEIKGTAYNLLNAVTEYSDHFKPVRQTAGKAGMSDNQIRKEGALFGGTGESLKSQALETILEMTAGLPERDATTVYQSGEIPTAAPDFAKSSINKIMDMIAV